MGAKSKINTPVTDWLYSILTVKCQILRLSGFSKRRKLFKTPEKGRQVLLRVIN
jgi:hypothetical protein